MKLIPLENKQKRGLCPYLNEPLIANLEDSFKYFLFSPHYHPLCYQLIQQKKKKLTHTHTHPLVFKSFKLPGR